MISFTLEKKLYITSINSLAKRRFNMYNYIKQDQDGFYVISGDGKWRSLTVKSFERAEQILIGVNTKGTRAYNKGEV